MKFAEEDYQYLSGNKFSTGYCLKLEGNTLYSRTETILRLVSGKRCIHIGCCDHIPVIEEKIKSKIWLHGILEECCTDILGIDINKKAVDYVNKKNLCKNKVYYADITETNFIEKIPNREFDYVLLGEVVEHLDNPVYFLKNMKENLRKYGFKGRYIITVPNAFCFLQNPVYKNAIECINTDHRYWFTPYTIAKIMIRADIKPEELYFACYGRVNNVSYCGDQIITVGI